MISSIHFMYLNVGKTDGVSNKVLGQVKGTAIIQYGHMGKRYKERISTLYDITKIEELRFDSIIKQAQKTIKENYKNIVTSCNRTTRNILYYEIPVRVKRVNYVIEIAVLLTSSLAKYNNDERIVSKEYGAAFLANQIQVNHPVICIETVIATVKLESDERKAYTEYNVIKSINVNNVNLTIPQFKQFTSGMKYNMSTCSLNAKQELLKIK